MLYFLLFTLQLSDLQHNNCILLVVQMCVTVLKDSCYWFSFHRNRFSLFQDSGDKKLCSRADNPNSSVMTALDPFQNFLSSSFFPSIFGEFFFIPFNDFHSFSLPLKLLLFFTLSLFSSFNSFFFNTSSFNSSSFCRAWLVIEIVPT